ncbi:MAG: acylphosphatase [bacterium]
MAELARARVLISGLVQGVGFRYFVTSTAEQFPITGYVRNLDTGSVEIVAEGDKEEVYGFLRLLRKGPAHAEIISFQTEWSPYQGKFKDFFVKY